MRLDLDRDRLREIVGEAYDNIALALNSKISRDKQSIMAELETIITSNRVSIPVYIVLGVDKAPDMKLRVDLRRREVFAQSAFRKKQAKANRFIRNL